MLRRSLYNALWQISHKSPLQCAKHGHRFNISPEAEGGVCDLKRPILCDVRMAKLIIAAAAAAALWTVYDVDRWTAAGYNQGCQIGQEIFRPIRQPYDCQIGREHLAQSGNPSYNTLHSLWFYIVLQWQTNNAFPSPQPSTSLQITMETEPTSLSRSTLEFVKDIGN